jgi:hypothetical protein
MIALKAVPLPLPTADRRLETMKPQEPIPHNYSMEKLNLIFALSSLALLLP